jgi:hypothetical protein
MSGFIKHAQSLTLDQWRKEFWISDSDGPHKGPLWNGFMREIRSFAQREVVRSFAKRHCLDAEIGLLTFSPTWIIHCVSVSKHFCSFPLSAYFFGSTETHRTGLEEILAVIITPKGQLILDDADQHLRVVGVEAAVQINDDAQMSSQIIEVFIQSDADSDRAQIDWQTSEGCLMTSTMVGGLK